ncbi:MAG: YigZ family protein [Saprospiraceae bacterium]|jgi:uncharacterized YigZ family protein|nr:YigZ family protein [Saprospiraceae bacterium]
MSATFQTIAGQTVCELKEKGSRFFGIAVPFSHEKELSEILTVLKDTYPKASHYCFAYRIGVDGTKFRVNDDGEPSGSAGRPILGAIDSAGLTNVLVVIVRYFGGTKLGIPGLIQAYKETGRLVLTQAEKVTKEFKIGLSMRFSYQRMGEIMGVLKELHIEIQRKDFNSDCHVVCSLPLKQHTELVTSIKAAILGWTADRVNESTEVADCSFELLDISF